MLLQLAPFLHSTVLMKKPILIIVVCLLVLASCSKIVEPTFKRIDGFGLKKLGLTETVVGFNIAFFNPNNFGLTVKKTAIDVYVDSVLLGRFTQPQETNVAKKSEFVIPLQGAVSLGRALELNLPSLIGKEVFVQAIGNVRVGKAGVYVTKDVKYAGRHVLDVNLTKNPARAGF